MMVVTLHFVNTSLLGCLCNLYSDATAETEQKASGYMEKLPCLPCWRKHELEANLFSQNLQGWGRRICITSRKQKPNNFRSIVVVCRLKDLVLCEQFKVKIYIFFIKDKQKAGKRLTFIIFFLHLIWCLITSFSKVLPDIIKGTINGKEEFWSFETIYRFLNTVQLAPKHTKQEKFHLHCMLTSSK